MGTGSEAPWGTQDECPRCLAGGRQLGWGGYLMPTEFCLLLYFFWTPLTPPLNSAPPHWPGVLRKLQKKKSALRAAR